VSEQYKALSMFNPFIDSAE